MSAMASGHGMVSGGAAFWASCAAAPVIAANVNSATVILACCMRFPPDASRVAQPDRPKPIGDKRNYKVRIGDWPRRHPKQSLSAVSDPDGVQLKSEVHFSDDELPVAHSRDAPPLSRDRGRHPDVALVRLRHCHDVCRLPAA